MSRASVGVALVAGLASSAIASVASAQSSAAGTVRWAWVRAEDAQRCADAPTLARAIESRLQRRVFDDTAARSIEGSVERSAQGWRARWILRAEDGAIEARRELTDGSPECDAIVEAVTLTVALAIDPSAPLAAPPRSPARAAQPAPCPTLPAPRAPAPVVASQPAQTVPRAPVRAPVRTTVRATGAWGALPNAAPGVGLAVDGALAGRVRWMIDATFAPEQRFTAIDREFAFGYTSASAAGCVDMLDPGRFVVAFCGAVALAVTHVVVFDLEPTQPGARPWVAAMLRARFTARIAGPLMFEAGADAGLVAVRYSFTARGAAAPIFTQSLGALQLFGGIGLEL